MKQWLFLLLLLVLFTPASFGQKVREKKDVVYVNDQPQYKVVKTSAKGLAQMRTFVYLSMTDDSLVWLRQQKLTVPQLTCESSPKTFYYYQISFKGTDEVVDYMESPFPVTPTFNILLVNGSMLLDGGVNVAALPGFREKLWEHRKMKKDFEKVIAHREQLLKNPKYADYMKGMKERDPDDKLGLSGNQISLTNAISQVNVITL